MPTLRARAEKADRFKYFHCLLCGEYKKTQTMTAHRINHIKTGACAGFTILELLVVMFVMTCLAGVVIARFGALTESAAVQCAITEMNSINEAIKDGFYPDLGFIPEDPGKDGRPGNNDDRPEYSTRYLCMSDTGVDPGRVPDSFTEAESYDMWIFLRSQIDPGNQDNKSTKKAALSLLAWNKYNNKGWRGPYMNHDGGAYFSSGGMGKKYYFPLITTPWFENCENNAQQEEEKNNKRQALNYRKGGYYLILGGQDKNMARIVCFGSNGVDDGSESRQKGRYYDGNTWSAPPENFTLKELFRLPNRNYEKARKFPDEPAYYTGDDIVVFIFSGGSIRCP